MSEPEEFYIEKKLKRGVHRAFKEANVEGFHDSLYWHVIEYSAYEEKQNLADLWERRCNKQSERLSNVDNARLIAEEQNKIMREALEHLYESDNVYGKDHAFVEEALEKIRDSHKSNEGE